ncbi:MAG: LysM peptidoglycan-binding domain-containing protein [Acidimicrobiia bacterium]|nr:LysM peptidoglycan-binding domain-containing protein [Acidimicrobiia bacterium]
MMRHATTILRGIGALIASLVFVIAVPAGLVSYVGWPLPTTLPSIDRIQIALRGGIDPQILINTLAVIVWIVWIQIVIVLLAEAVAAVRGGTARRLPVLPGLQPATAQLVAAITLAVATLGPLRVAPAAASPLPDPVSVTQTHQTSSSPGLGPTAVAAGVPAPHRGTNSDLPTYRVRRHDTLWSIAETTLDDGRRWKEIRDLNNGRTMVDGHDFTKETDRLSQGWLILLPNDASTPDTGQVSRVGSEVTVEAGDNFWTIAETTLETAWGRAPTGDEVSKYWRSLVESNRDRLRPPHDPNLIFPGQQLELPPTPTDANIESAAPQVSERTESANHDEVTVAPGDTFWSIAEDTLTDAWDRTPTTSETTNYTKQLIEANQDRLEPPHDPNLIHPGQVFRLPTIPDDPQAPAQPEDAVEPLLGSVPSPVLPDEPPTTETPGTDLLPAVTQPTPTSEVSTSSTTLSQPESPEPTDRSEPADTTAASDARAGSDLLPIASTLAGLGILAAGLVALLRRLRGVQLRHRRPGTIPTPPPADTVETETAIRTAAAPDSTEFIDLALRAMAQDVIDSHAPAPEVVGVHLTTEKLRLLLWTPHQDPPPEWSVDDDGRSWTISTNTDIARLRHKANGVAGPYPALVSVGHQDQAQLLLDLEYLGATQITGDPDDVASTCYTMATELAASPAADGIQIICVGFGADLAHMERVQVVDHLGDILPTLDAKATAITRMASPSPLHGRISSPGGDTWDPIVVFDPAADPTDEADRLLTIAHAGRAVAAVVGYPTGNRWQLHIDNDTVRIEPLGSTFARRNLTPTEQTAVANLVAAAKDLEGLPPKLTTDPLLLNEPVDIPVPLDEPTETADSKVTEQVTTRAVPEVKMLGTLRVDGLDADLPLRRGTELVAYLTFHRHGVEADALMEALWPEEAPDYRRLNRHTSRTRTTLGLGPDGEHLLSYVRDGRYRISPHLRSDIEQFTDHIRQADRATGADEADHLRSALQLVEGTPFTGAGNSYGWAHTDGIITHTIVAIDNAAHRLAEYALTHGDPEQATWAARKGLVATGACEECYRNLMRAAIAEGNQVALEAVYTELLAVIDADEGPDAATFLDPKTVELYEGESRGRRRQAG